MKASRDFISRYSSVVDHYSARFSTFYIRLDCINAPQYASRSHLALVYCPLLQHCAFHACSVYLSISTIRSQCRLPLAWLRQLLRSGSEFSAGARSFPCRDSLVPKANLRTSPFLFHECSAYHVDALMRTPSSPRPRPHSLAPLYPFIYVTSIFFAGIFLVRRVSVSVLCAAMRISEEAV